MLPFNGLNSSLYDTMYSVMHVHITVFCLINVIVKVETKDILGGDNRKERKIPFIHYELFD